MAALAITLVVNVPINSMQKTWDVAAPPGDWAAIRDRWQWAHGLRTVLAAAGFGCALVGLSRFRVIPSPVRSTSAG